MPSCGCGGRPAGRRGYRDETISLMAVRSSPSICTSAKAGMQTRSRPLGATNPRAMAMALTAWLMAAAPMAWSSAVPFSRTTPARAPATAVGLDLAATLSTDMGTCLLGSGVGESCERPVSQDSSGRTAGFLLPLPVGAADPRDAQGPPGLGVHVHHDAVELGGARGHLEAGRQEGEKPLEDALALHPDDGVPGAGHARIEDEGGPRGRIRSSAGWTSVGLPTTAETRPSRYQARAAFSEVASACMSTMMIGVSRRSLSTSSAPTSKGDRRGCMNTRPSRLRTATRTAPAPGASKTPAPRPGVPGG